jgi:hypothetical protein
MGVKNKIKTNKNILTMKSKKNEKGESIPDIEDAREGKQMGRRVAIKTIKYAAISAATLMVLMPSKAKADSSSNPNPPPFG